jgi:hypothetical protein
VGILADLSNERPALGSRSRYDPAGGESCLEPANTVSVPGVILRPESDLYTVLQDLAGRARMVFLAGLQGTGKSLVTHQPAHLAHAQGRNCPHVAPPRGVVSSGGANAPLCPSDDDPDALAR